MASFVDELGRQGLVVVVKVRPAWTVNSDRPHLLAEFCPQPRVKRSGFAASIDPRAVELASVRSGPRYRVVLCGEPGEGMSTSLRLHAHSRFREQAEMVRRGELPFSEVRVPVVLPLMEAETAKNSRGFLAQARRSTVAAVPSLGSSTAAIAERSTRLASSPEPPSRIGGDPSTFLKYPSANISPVSPYRANAPSRSSNVPRSAPTRSHRLLTRVKTWTSHRISSAPPAVVDPVGEFAQGSPTPTVHGSLVTSGRTRKGFSQASVNLGIGISLGGSEERGPRRGGRFRERDRRRRGADAHAALRPGGHPLDDDLAAPVRAARIAERGTCRLGVVAPSRGLRIPEGRA